MVIIDILRIASTTVGGIVILMYLAGTLDFADFILVFRVK